MNIKQLKAELFTYGIRFNEKDFEELKKQNPYNENRAGLSAGKFLILEKRWYVNVPIWENFVKYSPYMIKNGELYKEDKLINVNIKFAPSPNWISQKLESGRFAGEIIQPHGYNTLATMLFGCELQANSNQCKFCIAPKYDKDTAKSTEDIIEAIGFALKYNPKYSMSINIGTLYTEGRGLEKIIPYVKAIRDQYPNFGILLEFAPPKDLSLFTTLKEVNRKGELGVMMTANFWSETAMNIIQPGKTKLIPKRDYIEAWKESINILGKGSTSTVLICGVESESVTKSAIDEITNLGVIVDLIILRPTTGTNLTGVPLDPSMWLRLTDYARSAMLKKGIEPKQVGCINCGGCSLTIN